MKNLVKFGSVVAATLCCQPAFAQADAAPQGAASGSSEIVVTALRRETSLSKTPLAISAVSGEDLVSAGIADARDLNAVVPNFALTQDSYDARIAIRGVTSTDSTEKGDASVAFLMDGIYIARPADALSAFYDLERVEVLRGPQGTLYGRNTTAGVVNVITARPKTKFEASFDAHTGNLGARGATGMINVPVGDTLGVRLAANYERRDSYVLEGVDGGVPLDPGRKDLSARLSFGGKISENFDFVIRGDYSHAGGNEFGFVDSSNFFNMSGPIGVDPDYLNPSSKEARTLAYAPAYSGERNDKRYGIMTEMTYHLGAFDLTYLGGYRRTTRDDDRNTRIYRTTNVETFYTGRFNNWSHELRASYGEGTAFFAQTGLYYFREKSFTDYELGPQFASLIAGPNARGYHLSSDPFISESRGAFGQATVTPIDNLHLTGGIRYSKDKKSRRGGVYFDMFDPATQTENYTLSAAYIADASFDKITWKAGVDYDIDGLGLVYGSVSTGYKAGGFNDGCVAGGGTGCALTEDTLYFNPETITAYEAGYKFNLFDRRVQWNLSAFHYDYKDLQLSTFATNASGGPVRLVQNAGTAKVDGIETDIHFSPWTNARLDFSGAYTDARYDDFVAQLATGQSRDFHGSPLDHAPKWSGSIGFEQTFPLADGGDVAAKILSNYSSSYAIIDLARLVQYRQPSFTKTDVSLTYNAPNKKWYIQAFGKNLENEVTLSHVGSGFIANASIGEPRTYGLRFGFKY
ncbi:TonB-dependent receptor [Sphingobium sp.]|uniref:TonB-dependent receptor n=1 Tax=Sphingobium sp. TaxID=1912891 RepID=UPI002624ABBB|nr:TonB-dependent receptor [Sphingobium sp.]